MNSQLSKILLLVLFFILALFATFRRDIIIFLATNKQFLILMGLFIFAVLFILVVGLIMKKKVEPPKADDDFDNDDDDDNDNEDEDEDDIDN